MNEKIKALYHAARKEPDGRVILVGSDINSFAELIIREAAGLYFRNAIPGITREQDMALAVAIKEHFGVK